MTSPTLANPARSSSLLFEHFATLATAPEGIARLRELVLQLAVQGKLGTQDAGDEPASLLLEKIRKEKERLVKKGEISKSCTFPKIESEEIPFHLPKNWIWLRLDDIGYTCGQKVPDKVFTYIDVTAINKERGLIGDEVNVLQPNEAPSRARKLVKKGTVIYSTVRPYLLNIAIVDKDFNPEPIVSTAFAIVHPFEGISNRYLFYYLRSKPFVEYVESQMTGMAYPAINDQKFHMGLIPIPPSTEQHRIVAKVDRLMAICDELEARQQQERAGCLKLGTASLAGLQNAESPEEFGRQWAQVCDAFDLILNCPENVAVLRQTILQMAVQGRLVRQEPGDEPASHLVKKMGESDKDVLSLSDIPPFELPVGWEWITFEMILKDRKLLSYGILMPGAYDPSGIPMVRVMDIGEKTLNHTNIFRVSQDLASQYERTKIVAGDILLAVMATVGRAIVAPPELNNANVNRALAVIKIHPTVDSQYLCYVIRSPLFQNLFLQEKIGSAQPRINLRKLRQFPVPLPPLAEQHRIVAKVDALMALCDALESRLKERAGVQGRLANAIVKGVVS